MSPFKIAAGAAAVLLVGSGVAVAAGGTTATCTPSPVVTTSDTSAGFDVHCDVPLPAPVTSTVTETQTETQTVTATPSPTSAPVATTSSTTATATPSPSTTTATPAPTTSTAATTTYPSSATTGVPAGTTLATYTGPSTITTAGTVIDGKAIAGNLVIRANNVRVSNSRLTFSSYSGIQVDSGFTGVVVDHVELNGKGLSGTAGSIAINAEGSVAVKAANIYGVENAFQPYANSSMVDSWVHNLLAPGKPHYDGVQMDGYARNVVLDHNFIDMHELGSTATVMIDDCFGPSDNITVSNSRLLGGSYTVYMDSRFSSSNNLTNVKVLNNRIGGGQYGPFSWDTFAGDTYTATGNVDDTTGKAIAP